ncbi:hypothetical protein HYP99_gp103 [Sinorhizobium phage ort11]|uniref:HTH luxR-type domain-containing protein n=1 Tax=Sinorhizobium phage ort11 TaxID=2599764 RepID=A0A5C2H260_9CAUD|nr:hypothetical protein HYP99_gp103 [Sinorhizobium phage ort11]QEP29890.1 hypothetical protein Smphiort11_092 [Sinorhizobium phage ort11]
MKSECPLTEPQLEVIRWFSYGKTYEDIASILNCTVKAVNRRMERAWQSTGTFNKTALVAMALRQGWIE